MSETAPTVPAATPAAPAPSRTGRRWWRRNRWGLLGILVLAPATIALTFSNEWGGYYAERPSVPVGVAAGERAEFGGTAWQLIGAERIPGDDPAVADAGLPEGADLIVVSVAVDPQLAEGVTSSSMCTFVLNELADGSVLRSWRDALSSGVEYVADPDAAVGCDSERTSAYTAESHFVVPEDAGDEFAVDVQLGSEFPRFLRLGT
ncbi:hypothetical protein [Herbiconiux sp.]|uniref:hypothetical protein n=1 Tax=Herbiconiux sp. TaxID=1871186 RepID=UPI0025C58136|nr:hypothetical protein [Herbiconiux sp.]